MLTSLNQRLGRVQSNVPTRRTTSRLTRRVAIDLLLAMSLFFGGALVGGWHVSRSMDTPEFMYHMGPAFFEPYVMWVCGRGFAAPQRSTAALHRFSLAETKSFSCADLPRGQRTLPPKERATSHLYLLSTIAVLWSLFG